MAACLFANQALQLVDTTSLQSFATSLAEQNYLFWFASMPRSFACGASMALRHGDAIRFGLDDVSREHAGDLRFQLSLPWR